MLLMLCSIIKSPQLYSNKIRAKLNKGIGNVFGRLMEGKIQLILLGGCENWSKIRQWENWIVLVAWKFNFQPRIFKKPSKNGFKTSHWGKLAQNRWYWHFFNQVSALFSEFFQAGPLELIETIKIVEFMFLYRIFENF